MLKFTCKKVPTYVTVYVESEETIILMQLYLDFSEKRRSKFHSTWFTDVL